MNDAVLPAAWNGLALVFSWPNVLYPVLGTIVAMYFAMLPGLSGITLMALAIPLTYTWQPVPVVLLFGAFVGGATFMGSVTAILFNVPGMPTNAVTLLDGYPMAQAGRAKTALACSAAASALGSTVGILVLIVLIPIMRQATLLFGPPELLMLTIWGLTTIAALSRGSTVKGLIAAGIGLLLSFVGQDPRTAELRFTFGLDYLRDGIDLTPVFLGLLALSEMISLMASGRTTISNHPESDAPAGGTWEGVRALWTHFGLFLRSSIIGTAIGIIPGVGGTVAGFIAYQHAVQSSGKDGGSFGKGDIRGVLAPEAAIDAKDGGSLVPLLAFGVPGSVGTAMLLVVLTIHGLTPGREMLSTQLPLVFALIGSLFLSNWLTSIFGFALIHPFTRLTTIRTHRVVPLLVVMALAGAYLQRGLFADVFVACALGCIGYWMKRHGWPRVPLVIALALGALFENNLLLTLRLQELGRISFFTRPVILLLAALCLVALAYPANARRQRRMA